MKIALLAPVEETVPPLKYGGTELVVNNLCVGLRDSGHDVHLYAAGTSTAPATLKTITDKPLRQLTPHLDDSNLREQLKLSAVLRTLELMHGEHYDVIHNHVGSRIMPFLNELPGPLVTTLHKSLDEPDLQSVYGQHPDSAYVSVSNAQRRAMPNLNYQATVYNGIETEIFEFNDTPQDYFVFLGRMSPKKGASQAIALAKKAGVKLIMAAKTDAVDQSYYQSEIKPHIDGDQITFIGEVDHPGKVALLKNARGLLAPIQWEEPFGLFIVEAMACGTPPIAYNRGSMSELITDRENGFLVDVGNEASFVERIRQINTIDRKKCFEQVKNKFSVETMTDGYLEVYAKLANTNRSDI